MRTEHKPTRGFSLVELMVSLTIFSIVMVVSVGTLLVMIDANAKAQALYSVMTNLSFAIDSVTRNVRTGHAHYCASSEAQVYEAFGRQGSLSEYKRRDCTTGQNTLVFTREIDDERIGYRLHNGAIQQREGSDGSWLDITASDVFIERFEFTTVGTTRTGKDTAQPQIALLVEGYVLNGLDTETDFRLQTRVSQRILDY